MVKKYSLLDVYWVVHFVLAFADLIYLLLDLLSLYSPRTVGHGLARNICGPLPVV